jgi:hypothetical protein
VKISGERVNFRVKTVEWWVVKWVEKRIKKANMKLNACLISFGHV